MSLYQISKEYEEILSNLYDDEDNINEKELMKLEENNIALEKKAIAIACFIKNMDAEREAIDNAKKSMIERERRYKKKIDDLQGYLLSNMERRGITNITCPYFEIKVKKCPPSVHISNESIVPLEYKREKIEILPDKIKMKEEMMMGVIIPGVTLKQGLRLDIK